MKVSVSRSERKGKKLKIVIDDGKQKTIHIGSEGMEDYTTHGDDSRKKRYTDRHKKREDWTKSGITTAGFWAKHLLWNKKTLQDSKKDISSRFNVSFT